MKRKKQKAIYVVLAILLGDLGIHKFYIRKYKSGIMYLLFCWTFIPWLFSLYDAVMVNKSFAYLECESNNINDNYNSENISANENSSTIYFQRNSTFNEEKNFYDEEKIILSKYKDLVTPKYIKNSVYKVNNNRINNGSFYIEISTSLDGFIKDSIKYRNIKGSICDFVPLKCYYTTFDDLNDHQKKWYFYWRQSVLNGNYIDTDLSYIFLLIYELINYSFNDNAAFNISMLELLRNAYSEREPKLNKYLESWINDFLIELGVKNIKEENYLDQNKMYKILKKNEYSVDQISITNWKSFINEYNETKFFINNKNKIYSEFKKNMEILSNYYTTKNTSFLKEWFTLGEDNKNVRLYNAAIVGRETKEINIKCEKQIPKQKMYQEITQMFRLTENIVRTYMGEKRKIKVVEEQLPKEVVEYFYNSIEELNLDRNIKSRFKNVKKNQEGINVKIPNKKFEENIAEDNSTVLFDDEKINSLNNDRESLINLFNNEYDKEVNEKNIFNKGEKVNLDKRLLFQENIDKGVDGIRDANGDVNNQFLNDSNRSETDLKKVTEFSKNNKVKQSSVAGAYNKKIEYKIVEDNSKVLFDDEKIDSLNNDGESLINLFNNEYDEEVNYNDVFNNEEKVNLDDSLFFQENTDEDEDGFINALSEIEKQFLKYFDNVEIHLKKVSEFSKNNNIMPSLLIDNINEKAVEFLGDNFIELDDDIYSIYKEYNNILNIIRG